MSKQQSSSTIGQKFLETLRVNWLNLLGVLLVFFLCVGLTVALLRVKGPDLAGGKTPTTPTATPPPTPAPPQALTVLLLGYGGGEHDGGTLTDTMMVARIDPVAKLIVLLSVPRDLWVPLPLQDNANPVWGKINSAYSIGSDVRGHQYRTDQFKGEHGGGTLAKALVATVTGIKPEYYAAVNFDAFIQAIDTIGPLTVNVPYAFVDAQYPIRGQEKNLCQFTEADLATLSATFKGAALEQQFACRYETLTFTKGRTQMDGVTALKFVRSRHGNVGGSDFGRAERQQALVEAVKQKVFSLSFLPRIPTLVQQIQKDVTTDVPLSDIPALLGRFKDITSYKLYSISLTDANVLQDAVSSDRQFILQPRAGQGNWAGIQQYIDQEIKTATASAVASDSAKTAPATAIPASTAAQPKTSPAIPLQASASAQPVSH